jgi:hypothetical protein
LGGSCVDNVCSPVPISQTPDGLDVVVEGGFVYWTGFYDYNVYKIAIDSDAEAGPLAPQALLAQQEGFAAASLAIDQGNLYWNELDGPHVRLVSTQGATTSEVLAFMPDHVSDNGRVSVVGDYVYWSAGRGCPPNRASNEECFEPTAPPGAIFRVHKDGSDAMNPELLHEAPLATGIAADDSHVYWAQEAPPFGLFKLPLDDLNGMPELIAEPDSYIADIAIVAGRLYWTDGPRVRSQPIGGGTITTATADPMAGDGDAIDLAFDANHVFFGLANGQVFRTGLDTASDVVEIGYTGGAPATGIGVGCDAVFFFANGNPSLLFRVAK